MKNAAKKIETFPPAQEHGTVTRIDDAWIEVVAGADLLRCRRAASCLLAPSVGDEVLVAIVANRPAYVLAVLERSDATPAQLDMSGDTALRVRDGRLSIAADGIDLLSTADTNVISKKLEVRATEARATLDEIGVFARRLLAEVSSSKWIHATLERVADRVVERVGRSYRFVEQAEHVRAERIDYEAKKELTIRAENAVIVAEELAKIDAGQIHMG